MASQFRILHFATHSFIDRTDPDRSGLVLSIFDQHGSPVDGLLHGDELATLGLVADLVVLSGCGTALEPTGGDGFGAGLATDFLRAGAGSVIASLWDVDDQATSELMTSFYRALITDHRPAEALRAAQLELSRRPERSAPFYWAGFILVGDWR